MIFCEPCERRGRYNVASRAALLGADDIAVLARENPLRFVARLVASGASLTRMKTVSKLAGFPSPRRSIFAFWMTTLFGP
jgi:hypothetical protein